MGGWVVRTASALTGTPRSIIAWRSNAGARWLSVGTHSKLYAIDASATITDITPSGFTAGAEDTTANTGYGYGNYGASTYGTPRPDTGSVTTANNWQLDTWGEELVACATSDGKLYKWDLNVSNDGVAITNAPTSCTGLIVTEERHLMALGAGGNPRKVQWSDQEAITVWTPSQTNKAGSFNLQTTGSLKCARRVRGGVLLWTDIDVHQAQSLGYPLVYGFQKVGSNCGVIGPNAVVAVDSLAYWMGRDSFYVFDGTVRPLPCEVQDYVFSDLNPLQTAKFSAFYNSTNSEAWFLYCSSGSSEIDRYVALNTVEGHWTIGSLDRVCGVDRGVFTSPILVGSDGYLYDHETGHSYGTSTPYAESGPIEMGNGDRVMHAVRLVPDEQTSADCTVAFKHRYWPNGDQTTTSTYTLASPTSVRFTGRQIAMRVTGSRLADWRWGTPRIELRPGGGRG
jgi:hypothetical protein